MGTEVQRTTTPLSLERAAVMLRAALEQEGLITRAGFDVAGGAGAADVSSPAKVQADRHLAELVLALFAVETARGEKIQNHNWGNISTSAERDGLYWRPPWFSLDENSSERDRKLHQRMLDKTAPSAFRAYVSAQQGAAAYVKFLKGARYEPLLRAARSGDASAFVQALHDTRYSVDYTVDKHAATFSTLQNEFRLRGFFGAPPASPPSPAPPAEPSGETSEPVPVRVVQDGSPWVALSMAIGVVGVALTVFRIMSDHRQVPGAVASGAARKT